jgi:hypothetical protein
MKTKAGEVELRFEDSVEEGGSDSGGDGDGGGAVGWGGGGARGRKKRAVRPVKPICGIEY